MKYKFDLSPGVKRVAEWELRNYRDNARQLEAYKADMIPSPVKVISPTSGVSGGGAGRDTEDVAMRILSSPYLRRLEQSVEGIGRALRLMDETDLELIRLVYWDSTFTVYGAAPKVGLSVTGAYARINKILAAVAYELGLVQ